MLARVVLLGVAWFCGVFAMFAFSEVGNDRGASGTLYLGEPQCQTRTPDDIARCAVRLIMKQSALPEIGSDALTALSKIELTHVSEVRTTPCRRDALETATTTESSKGDGTDIGRGAACSLIERDDSRRDDWGATIVAAENAELGVGRLQLFSAPAPARRQTLLELVPGGANALAVIFG